MLLFDSEYSEQVRDVLALLDAPPRAVRIEDREFAGDHGTLGDAEYEAWLCPAPMPDWSPARR